MDQAKAKTRKPSPKKPKFKDEPAETWCRLCGDPCSLNMVLRERDFRGKVEDITGERIPVAVGKKATRESNVCDPCRGTVEEFFRYKAHCRDVLEGRLEQEGELDLLLENCEVEVSLPEEALEEIVVEQTKVKKVTKERRYAARHQKTEEEKAMSTAEYQIHFRKMYGSRYKIECEMCHQKVAKSYLDGHMNRHYGLEPHACPHCDVRFHCQMNLRKHLARSHAPEEESIPCDVCGKMIQSRIALKQHMKSHEEKTFECKQCGLKARNAHTLKRHMDIHNKVRDFVCPHCGKTFYRQYVLNIHLRTHTGETPYVCHVCPKGFVHRRVYMEHMKKQHPTEPTMRLDLLKGIKESVRNSMGM